MSEVFFSTIMNADSNPDDSLLSIVVCSDPACSDTDDNVNSADHTPSSCVGVRGKHKGAAAPSSVKADQGHSKMNYTDKSKVWPVFLLIAGVCCTTCVICAIVISGVLWDDLVLGNHPEEKNVKVRVSCDDITYYYPVAGLHMNNDNYTNDAFKAEGIVRVKDEADGSMMCELPAHQLMGNMARAEYDVVDARVTLEAKTMGEPLTYSKYPLSIKSRGFLRQVGIDSESLTVQKAGIYFVYLGIELDYKEDFCRKQPHNVRHNLRTFTAHVYIKETKRTKSDTLLWVMHTCNTKTKAEKDTSFIGGLFHLGSGDKIYVKVSAPEIVVKSDSNMLGLVRLHGKENE